LRRAAAARAVHGVVAGRAAHCAGAGRAAQRAAARGGAAGPLPVRRARARGSWRRLPAARLPGCVHPRTAGRGAAAAGAARAGAVVPALPLRRARDAAAVRVREGAMTPASLLPPLFGLVAAPLFAGMIAKLKARAVGRQGPPLLQPYRDLARLLRKGAVYSRDTTWVFRAGPLISALTAGAALFLIQI